MLQPKNSADFQTLGEISKPYLVFGLPQLQMTIFSKKGNYLQLSLKKTMRNSKKNFTLVIFLLLYFAPMALAQYGIDETASKAGLKNKLIGPSDYALEEIFGTIIYSFLGMLGAIFMFLLLLGGFEWMSAGGNEDKVKHAKTMIINAIHGMVVTMVSYALAGAVINALSSAAI